MPIERDGESRVWTLRTDGTAYRVGVTDEQNVAHRYWGSPLPYTSDYPEGSPLEGERGSRAEEAPPWGGTGFGEPVFKVTFPDHTRVIEADYHDARRTTTERGEQLVLTLRDAEYDLDIDLHYRLVEDHDLIERWTTITNGGDEPVTIERALSAQWTLPRWESYRLTHLCGDWGDETNVARTGLTQGKTVLDSRRGETSHQHNPWFAVDDGAATERDGTVYFGALAYSGNWEFVFEKDSDRTLTVSGGISAFDFSWHLDPEESFSTPSFVGGYTTDGFGSASRRLHEYQREHVLPDDDLEAVRPILYNSWYATGFDINEEQQKRLVERAAELGAELFVIDDGWFGERNDDTAGLGDWYVNEEKFPSGLDAFVDYVDDLGMGFGLWVEPEMVNPDSDLYREHPDWVYHFPDRTRSELRNQLVLNLAREDVREYVYDSLDRLLSEYGIDFVKWDMNRYISEPGWPDAPPERQQEIWVRHARAVYDVLDRLRETYPDVIFETCSGGGGRVDVGILERTHQAWTSDNVDPFDRLFIQEGYSYAYAPKTMENWVVDYPWEATGRDVGLEYGFHVAMTGSLGIGADLSEWSQADLKRASDLVETYKEVRSIVQNGRQFRLRSPRTDDPLAAVEYASHDAERAVVFLFLHSKRYGDVLPRVPVYGLADSERYRVGSDGPVMSGKALKERGLDVELQGDFRSDLIRIERVD